MKLLYPFAKRFIAGYDFNSAKLSIEDLLDQGYEVSIDYVGENSKSIKHCEKAYQQYLQITNFYKNKKIDISIKPSQLGININPIISYSFCCRLATRAKKNGHTIRLDMEDSKVTEATRNLAMSLNNIFGNVGIAIQANLFRTQKDLEILIEKDISIRLVKGAYKENKEIAHQSYFNISASFFDYAARLYSNKANKPAIATHDEELLGDIEELIPKPDYFDYEFLYGIRRDLQEDFLKKGRRVRVYVPFGENWLPYALRRLNEFKNLKFIILNMFKEWSNEKK